MRTSKLTLWPLIMLMALVIFVSNKLVQIPLQGIVFGIDLAAVLTWGAFTYPAAFLVTDTTNRIYGPVYARRVVAVGFALGVALTTAAAVGMASEMSEGGLMTLWQALLTDPEAASLLRIAAASGTAFLVAQLLDIKIFDLLRSRTWWKAPTASSLMGSFVDTLVFFSLAFAGTGLPWGSWAAGDFCAKLIMIALLLYPFRLVVQVYPDRLRNSV